ncbi:hypothetical protein GCM10009857_09170 [Agromyces soli]
MLWNTAGASPGSRDGPYQPSPKPSPFTVSAPSGEFSDCATSECFVSSTTREICRGSPEYASHRHIGLISSSSERRMARPHSAAATSSAGQTASSAILATDWSSDQGNSTIGRS